MPKGGCPTANSGSFSRLPGGVTEQAVRFRLVHRTGVDRPVDDVGVAGGEVIVSTGLVMIFDGVDEIEAEGSAAKGAEQPFAQFPRLVTLAIKRWCWRHGVLVNVTREIVMTG